MRCEVQIRRGQTPRLSECGPPWIDGRDRRLNLAAETRDLDRASMSARAFASGPNWVCQRPRDHHALPDHRTGPQLGPMKVRPKTATQWSGSNTGIDQARRFFALADLDNGVFDRFGRYETALWRQLRQTLFTLEALRWRTSKPRGWRTTSLVRDDGVSAGTRSMLKCAWYLLGRIDEFVEPKSVQAIKSYQLALGTKRVSPFAFGQLTMAALRAKKTPTWFAYLLDGSNLAPRAKRF